MSKRQVDINFSLFCQTHTQSKLSSVALKASLTVHLGQNSLGPHGFFVLWLFWFFFSWPAVSVFQSAAALWCVASIPGTGFSVAWNEARRLRFTLQTVLLHSSPTFLQLISFSSFAFFFFFFNSLANVSFSRYIYILFMTLSGLISVLHTACDSSCIMNEAAAAAADSLGTPRAYTHQHHWQLLTTKGFNTPAVLIAFLARTCFRKELWQF